MTKKFKECLIELDKTKQKREREKKIFEYDVIEFMRDKKIPVRVLFFRNTFGLEINLNVENWQSIPLKIPLDVLSDFCKEFGCDFEYTNCDGRRYIFSFDGLSMEF